MGRYEVKDSDKVMDSCRRIARETLKGNMGRYEVKDSDKVMDSCRRIARETLESAYSRVSEGDGKTEIFDDGNSVEYN